MDEIGLLERLGWSDELAGSGLEAPDFAVLDHGNQCLATRCEAGGHASLEAQLDFAGVRIPEKNHLIWQATNNGVAIRGKGDMALVLPAAPVVKLEGFGALQFPIGTDLPKLNRKRRRAYKA